MQNGFNKKLLFLENDELVKLPIKANILFEEQLANWPLALIGYKSLEEVQVKQFQFDNFTIEAHFNPGRLVSSSAKVDAKSIEARPCFLCLNSLPQEQKAIEAVNEYILLVNPFPIFDKHFTVPSTKHFPQSIKSEIKNMLLISSMLGENFSVFYNGPRCGASAPDHMHFQAGNFGFMNIDLEYDSIIENYGKLISDTDDVKITAVSGALRNFIALESNYIQKLSYKFSKVYQALSQDNSTEEPMMNILCTFNKSWRLLVFPRSKHRPTYYFAEDENKILISPAAVDLGGVLIFPREEDFARITKELIIDIFNQVTPNADEFKLTLSKLKN